MIKILIADDHGIFHGGLRTLLDSDGDITVVGEPTNAAECIKMLSNLKPDILLLDLRVLVKSGLAVLKEVNFNTVPTRVIVLTAAEDDRVRNNLKPICRVLGGKIPLPLCKRRAH
jgi:DNA-binding NarL/FixJ family response regulator